MAVQFTDAEWLILSSLCYNIPSGRFDKNGNAIKNNEISVIDMINQKKYDLKNYENEANLENYEKVIKSLEKKLENFVVSKKVDHNNTSGFVAFAIEPKPNEDNEVIVCCRGSDMDGRGILNDWLVNNASLATQTMTTHQMEMKLFMQGFEKYDSISLTGHSLGANLAMYGAITFPFKDKIKDVYAVNGPGFNEAFVNLYAKEINKVKDKIHNFQNEHDVVSSLLNNIGKISIFKSALKSTDPFKNHSALTIQIDENGSLVLNESGKKDAFCTSVHYVTSSIVNKLIAGEILIAILINKGTSLATHVGNIIKMIIKNVSNNNASYIANNPLIQVNTNILINYADRISNVNRRLSNLDNRLDSLYTKVKLVDLLTLLQADLGIKYNYRLHKCVNYLKDTSSEFEKLERTLASQL